jgi:hypothetical protein
MGVWFRWSGWQLLLLALVVAGVEAAGQRMLAARLVAIAVPQLVAGAAS